MNTIKNTFSVSPVRFIVACMGMDYFGRKYPDRSHTHESGGETEGRSSRKIRIDVHGTFLLAKNFGDICLHVASDCGTDAAQEGDEVDGDDASEQMYNAPAEIHGLIGGVAHET